MLEWNVYIGDINSRQIKVFNIFNHRGFYNDCITAKKKFRDNKEEFGEGVRNSLIYYYWSKCEWEVIIDHWPQCERFECKKVDVYSQVMNNWGIFIDYLFANKDLLKEG